MENNNEKQEQAKTQDMDSDLKETQVKESDTKNSQQSKSSKRTSKKISLKLLQNVKYAKNEKKIGDILEVKDEEEAELLIKNKIAVKV